MFIQPKESNWTREAHLPARSGLIGVPSLEVTENRSAPPFLQPPGAGLPWTTLIFLRYFINPFVASRTPWNLSQVRFQAATKRIEREIHGLTEYELQQRILIPPMRGLEDSSRYWSILMTLEHLTIVGHKIAGAISSLNAGVIPNEKANTAEVKPKGGLSSEDVLNLFYNYCHQLHPQLEQSSNPLTKNLKFYHPWFGPMNAQAWYWLMAQHHILHLRQIQSIKRQFLY